MSGLRPLPPQPSLEYERKEAKALLRQLRAGDPTALDRARVRHPALPATPDRIRLADAQLVVAREYGFRSWRQLGRYFEAVERLPFRSQSIGPERREFYEDHVQSLLVRHRSLQLGAARMLAAYVPRLYGRRPDEVFATTITEDDARVTVARRFGFPSWQRLIENALPPGHHLPSGWELDPMQQATRAMNMGDLEGLKRVVEAHPALLQPPHHLAMRGHTLLNMALGNEFRLGAATMQPIMEWLVSKGQDLQRALNIRLCGHMHMETAMVRHLLSRGADPDWVGPNGSSVLEHAIIRYWNGEAVDLLAARATPRLALWIAAGLGDVAGVSRFLDGQGRPTAAARRFRPDFDTIGFGMPSTHPDPDDEEILMEAFFVAMLNGRCAVIEYLASRNFNLNSLVWGRPVINIAVGNAMVSVVECLTRCGANVDLHGDPPQQSAREIARRNLEQVTTDAEQHRKYRRIAELCGLDADAVLVECDARPLDPPSIDAKVQAALELAGDDAFRLGQSEIREENLLFGLLRLGGLPLLYFGQVSKMDFDRFRADVADRVRHGTECIERPKLPLDVDAQTAIQRAIAFAAQRRRETMHVLHVLYALTESGKGPTADILARYGSIAEQLNEELLRAL